MRSSGVSITLGVFLLAAASLLFIAKKANNSLDRDLIATRSKADSLSKNNELLGDRVKRLNGKSDSLVVKNGELEKSIELTTSQLASKDREIWKTHKAAANATKKYDDLVVAKKDWDKQLANLKTANAQLGQENKSLSNKILLLNDDSKKLNDQINTSRAAAKDNILVETMAKSGKLEVRGRKVKKIVASLTVQSELKSPTFRVFDPSGNQLPEQNGSFEFKTVNEIPQNSTIGNSIKIELTYLLSKKLGAGLYRIEVLNDSKHIGNLLVRFR